MSGLSRCAGVVLVDKQSKRLKQVEFVSLGEGRALAVLVSEDGDVENRIISLAEGLPLSSLNEASNYINARIGGLTLAEARGRIEREIEQRRAQLNELTARVVTEGLATWSGTADDSKSLIVCGRAHLLEDVKAMEDLERVRLLFDDLDAKKDLIQLLGEQAVLSVRLSPDRVAVRGYRAENRRRAWGDRPDAAELRPHHSHGRLHGTAARAPCHLIFAAPRLISRTTAE